jgi:hypothetical protein
MRDANITIARRLRFRRHLRRIEPVLAGLRSNGHSEPNVLAILAVESFYRPRPVRALEYAVWALASLVAPASVGRISVGMAQLRLANWVELGLMDSPRFSTRRLRWVRGPEASYEACRRFLSARGALDEADPVALSRVYAGGDRRHFAVMLEQVRTGQSVLSEPRVAV